MGEGVTSVKPGDRVALLAAEHKKHIHMEKPGSTILSDFEKLVETVKKNSISYRLYVQIQSVYKQPY